MPFHVARRLALLITVGLGLVAGATWALAQWSYWLAGLAVLTAVVLAIYLVFVYLPTFDPFGLTLWRVNAPGLKVALTFDDGPSAHTQAVLALLKQYQAKATFFFLGLKAEQRQAIVEQARADGHAIGNHGYSHRKFHRLSAAEIHAELGRGAAAIGPLTTVHGRTLLRTPHGFKSLTLMRLLKQQGYVLAAWSAGVWDSDCPGVDVIVSRALAALKPGAVLLLHDGAGATEGDRSQTVAALARILEVGRARGYQFVTLAQLFESPDA